MSEVGLDYLHSYFSSRRPRDWNRCGQAAVATLLDYHGREPYSLDRPVFDPRDGGHHWNDADIIDRVVADHPPDHLFGLLGTTGERISRALDDSGLTTLVAATTSPTEGRCLFERIRKSLARGEPVITIVDRGKLGGRPFAPHWAVVYGAGETGVRLANTSGVSVVPYEQFMKAFRCSFMPASLRHCAIFVSS